jgi:hypothetical protein
VEGELRAAEGEADAAGDGLHEGEVGGEDLDGLDVDVDGRGVGRGVWGVPCAGFEVGGWRGTFLLLRGEGADADDGAADVAAEAVGEVLESALLGNGGSICAHQQPTAIQRA